MFEGRVTVSQRSEIVGIVGLAGISGARIDSLAFAREGRRLAGAIPLVELPRLAEVLVDTEGAIDCELLGEWDAEGRAFLVLRLSGDLRVSCQRCLEPMAVPLDVASRFLLVPPGRPWPEDELAEDDFDAIEAELEMALLPLIEDEVLLALPIAPRHEDCVAPMAGVDENESSPFAVLAKLKKGV